MMRITSLLLGGCLFGTLIGLTGADKALAQVPEPSPVLGSYARRPPVYPKVHHSQHAYRKAVKYGLAPVLPPFVTVYQEGHGLYGPPYYAYPRPPLGAPGYAGFSGTDPDAYRSVIPPPIPPTLPPAMTNPETLPSPPATEPIPTPPSDPKSK